MEDVRGTGSAMPARLDGESALRPEVQRLRRTVQALVVSQAVTLLAVVALVAVVERRSQGLKDAVWDAAARAEKAAREELPGAVAQTRSRLEEVEGLLKAIDAQARSLDASLAPGGDVAREAQKLGDDLRRSVRDAVRESVRREVAAALEQQRQAAAAPTP